jgi:hypothetical protein
MTRRAAHTRAHPQARTQVHTHHALLLAGGAFSAGCTAHPNQQRFRPRGHGEHKCGQERAVGARHSSERARLRRTSRCPPGKAHLPARHRAPTCTPIRVGTPSARAHTPYPHPVSCIRTMHHAPRTPHHAPRTTHHAPPHPHTHMPRTTHHAPRTTHLHPHSRTFTVIAPSNADYQHTSARIQNTRTHAHTRETHSTCTHPRRGCPPSAQAAPCRWAG